MASWKTSLDSWGLQDLFHCQWGQRGICFFSIPPTAYRDHMVNSLAAGDPQYKKREGESAHHLQKVAPGDGVPNW